MVNSGQGGEKTPPVRDDIQDLKPYSVPGSGVAIELDSNENPWNLPDDVLKDISETLQSVNYNRYPDTKAVWLKKSLAASYKLQIENVFLGNGSNEVILDLLLAFGGPGRTALILEPTYSMHTILARIALTETVKAQLGEDFEFDSATTGTTIGEHKPDIVFVNSPNNPTGNIVRPEAIENICSSGDFLVVVDEAYGEFSGETCLPLIKKYKNLAVVKTFSKAFRLAGARVGYALADEGIVSGLEKVRLPYNLNALSQVAAAMVWKKRSAILGVVDEIIAERERVAKILTEMDGTTPYPSRANFILFKTRKDAKGVYQRLVTSGVRIRDFSSIPRLKNCLRVTIGTPAENNVFLDVLRESL